MIVTNVIARLAFVRIMHPAVRTARHLTQIAEARAVVGSVKRGLTAAAQTPALRQDRVACQLVGMQGQPEHAFRHRVQQRDFAGLPKRR